MHSAAIAGVAAVSLTIGAASGYLFAKKRLIKQFDAHLEDQLAKAREHYEKQYKRTYKADTWATPEQAAEDLGVKVELAEAAEIIKDYLPEPETNVAIFEGPEVVKQDDDGAFRVVEKNIFDDGDQLTINKDERDTSKPYVIDIVEYMDKPDNWHDDIELTYYEGDRILGDDKDEPIADNKVDEIVGRMNLMLFGASDPDQPHILLVRNEKLKTDFEITHSDGTFAHQVAGFMHSDETFQRIRRNGRREE